MINIILLLVSVSFAQEPPKTDPKGLKEMRACTDTMQKLCPPSEPADCLQKKWNHLPASCQKLVSKANQNLQTQESDPKVKKCLAEMTSEKHCPFDAKMAADNPTAAAKKYQDCLEKNMNKLSSDCKTFFGIKN